jgi:hypothetical protein
MMRCLKPYLIAGGLALVLVGCDAFPAPPTPTVAPVTTPTDVPPTETPAVSNTPLPTPSLQQQVRLEPPPPSPTPGPPTPTLTLTPTLGPIEHTMQAGETLGYIIQLYGYTDFNVIDEIVAINANIPNADRVPGAGNVILIPRQSSTPTPEGFDPSTPPPVIEPEVVIDMHTVREGETIIGIAAQAETNLVILDRMNPELLFFNCDLSIPSGGAECNVPLVVGQEVKIPAPSPTPTLSPTPSGSETATLTPTYAAPVAFFPPEGSTVRSRSLELEWISTGILSPEFTYLVQVEDSTTETDYVYVTRDTSFVLGGNNTPTDGQPHSFKWRIVIATQAETGDYRIVSGENSSWRTFQWHVQ